MTPRAGDPTAVSSPSASGLRRRFSPTSGISQHDDDEHHQDVDDGHVIPSSSSGDSTRSSIVPTTTATTKKAKSKSRMSEKSPHYIRIDGTWYDVTHFIDRHPGGDLIKDYLDRDATDIFRAFHFRPDEALKRVRKMKDAPPGLDAKLDRIRNENASIDFYDGWKGDDEAFASDFRAMLVGLREDGYLEFDRAFMVRKMLVTVAFFVVGWTLVFRGTYDARLNNDPSLIEWKSNLFPGAICVALFLQQAGFLMHDFMHNNWFHNRKTDQMFGRFFGTICLGISATWWRDEHFTHHVFTNTVETGVQSKDPQMLEDVWAQDPNLVQFFDGSIDEDVFVRQMEFLPTWLVQFILRYQAFYWLPLTVGLGRIGIMLASFQREHRPFERFLQVCHVLWVVAMLTVAFPTWPTALAFYYLFSLGQGILHIQLLVSHYPKPWQELDNVKTQAQWYRFQVASTINIAPLLSSRATWRTHDSEMWDYWDDYIAPIVDDWFHGGLNLHIEHHTCPTLPRNALRECGRRIRKLCEKHDILYDERHFVTAVWDTLVHMNRVGMSAKFVDIAK